MSTSTQTSELVRSSGVERADRKARARPRSGERLLNRELSWLDYAERVLVFASEPGLPLLERVKLCAIYAGNLDEFFQVRVAGLLDQVAAEISVRSPDGRTPAETLA